MIMAMMKSSNTEWLGDIPAEWDVAQIGNYYELRNEKVSDYDFEPLSVTMKGIVTQLATAAKSDDHSNRKLVKKGDFVINSRSDRRGSCGISPLDGSVSLINIVMEPRGEMNPQYYNWLFHTEQFADEFYKWGHGIVDDLWTTRWQEMKKILIVAPLPDEQQAIADYLDETCSKIDEIIAEAKASIDEYKELKQSVIFEAVTKGLDKNVEMKDSGVEWIGLCPKHWVVSRIKNECSNLDNLREPVSADNRENKLGLYDYYGASGVIDKIDYYNVDDVVLLIGEDGANLRMRNLPLVYRASGKFWVNNHAHILKINERNDYEYMAYMLEAGDYSDYITGSAQPKLSQFNLMRFPIVHPPLNEQIVISQYLVDRIPQIDSLISEKESLINDLEAYKKSLIYEVVTGKRRVV
jgi:type I restriction enzyme, S subunit